MKAVTDDFVEAFQNEPDLNGPFFGLIIAGINDPVLRPEGLDYADERVKAILQRAIQTRAGINE